MTDMMLMFSNYTLVHYLSTHYDLSIVMLCFSDHYHHLIIILSLSSSYYPSSSFEQTATAVQGIEQIRARVSELDLAGARVDLTDGSMDAQVCTLLLIKNKYRHINLPYTLILST